MNKLFRLLAVRADDILLPMLMLILGALWFVLALIFVSSVFLAAKRSEAPPVENAYTAGREAPGGGGCSSIAVSDFVSRELC